MEKYALIMHKDLKVIELILVLVSKFSRSVRDSSFASGSFGGVTQVSKGLMNIKKAFGLSDEHGIKGILSIIFSIYFG